MLVKLWSAILCALAVALIVPSVSAQTSRSTRSGGFQSDEQRKYSFAIIGRAGSITCWGKWDSDSLTAIKGKEDLLYVRKGDAMYVITDAGIVRQAKSAVEPLQELGKQQSELGREQGKLGAQQGKLGAKQGEYGRQMGQASRERATGRYEQKMKDLSNQMRALGKQQGALGEKQKSLGARQSELGRRQSEAAKIAEEKITRLIDDAFARGLAKKV
jgi:bla regulator protein blaR1